MSDLDKNSLLYWWPKIQGLDIRKPQTYILCLSAEEKDQYWHGDSCDVTRLAETIRRLSWDLPMFLRTDLVSNKWMWQKACYVENYDNLESQLFELICFNRLADIMGLPIEAVIVREYIPMASAFKAFWGMPVNPERRYFVRDGKMLCHHPYWFEGSIKFYEAQEPKDIVWREVLRNINTENAEEIELLTGYAEQVAAVMEGFWSVDFCLAETGEWVLIDMAQGDKSWHPECEVEQ